MFAHLKGTIELIFEDKCIVDVHGVGYEVFVSSLTLNAIETGSSVKLHIETLMRQESLTLFGFLTFEELLWFRLLLTVQGVGPKVALGILGTLGLDAVYESIEAQDKVQLTRAPGVGAKLAGRILLELKEKIYTMKRMHGDGELSKKHDRGVQISREMQGGNAKESDVILALEHLGYSKIEAKKAVQQAFLNHNDDNTSVADMIRFALKYV